MDNSKAADKKQSKLYLEKLVATKWDGKMKNGGGGLGGGTEALIILYVIPINFFLVISNLLSFSINTANICKHSTSKVDQLNIIVR